MGTKRSLAKKLAGAAIAANLIITPAAAQGIATNQITPSTEDTLKERIARDTFSLLALQIDKVNEEVRWDNGRTPYSYTLFELQELLQLKSTDSILGEESAKAIIDIASQSLENFPLSDPILTRNNHPFLIRKLEVLAPVELEAYLQKVDSPTRRALAEKTTQLDEQKQIILQAAQECVGGKIEDPEAFINDATSGIQNLNDPIQILEGARNAFKKHCGKYLDHLDVDEKERILDDAVRQIGPHVGEFIHQQLYLRDLREMYNNLFKNLPEESTPKGIEAKAPGSPFDNRSPA
jgi:hypothetical protein